MPKERKKVSLRSVEEKPAAETPRLLRLHKDKVEVVEASESVERGGSKAEPQSRLEVTNKADRKVRSAEADATEVNTEGAENVIVNPEENWTGADGARKIPLGWVFLITAAFASAVIWSLVQVRESVERQDGLQMDLEQAIEQEEREKTEAGQLIAELERVAEAFYAAGSIEEMLPLVRHATRVRPLMEDYYSRYPLEVKDLRLIMNIKPLALGNYGGFWIVETLHDLDERGSLLLEVGDDGEVRVDWESRVRYQPIAWEDFATDRPGGYTGDFRVNVANDNYFSHEFSDSEKYECFRLSVFDSDEVLFGYVPKGGEKAARIQELIDRNAKLKAPMILRLHVPENLESRSGVLIKELVAPRWVFVRSPEKEAQ